MAFGDSIKLGNIQENWLFKLANNNSGYLYFAFSDVIYSSNYYRGVVLGNPSISESISLSKSTASTSGISIKIPDFDYNGSPISKELWGTNSYLNRVCTVHSKINDDTPNQIGAFRVSGMSSDGKVITIKMISHRAWDNITIPNVKSPKGNYFPIAFGDFSTNTSTVSSPALCDSRDLYPAPIEQVENDDFIALQAKNSTGGKLHFYEKSADIFVPLDDVNNNSVALGDGYVNKTDIDLHRAYKLRPNSIVATGDYQDFSDNGANTIDGDSNTYSALTESISSFSSSNQVWYNQTVITANVPQLQHECQEYKTGYTVSFTWNLGGIANQNDIITIGVDISDTTGGSYAEAMEKNYVAVFQSNGEYSLTDNELLLASGDQTGNGIINSTKATFTSSDYKSSIKGLSTDTITYRITFSAVLTNSSGGASAGSLNVSDLDFRLYDTFIQPQVKIPVRSTDEAKHNSASESIASVETLYAGNNGIKESYSGSNNAITEIHEAHRTMLINYAGMATTTPTGWSDLESSKDWKIRYWLTEPTLLKDVLEKLQYEGGFIFRERYGVPQYIHIPDSISTITTLTKNDIANISISNTPLTQISTKQNIGYEKHPAEDRYMTNVTSTNSTPRTTYNIDTKENIEDVELDAYVSPTIPTTPANSGNKANRNDDHYSYYNAINGGVFLECSFDMVNPEFYDLEVGHFIVFDNNNMYPETPFGQSSGTWTGLNMIITSTKRTQGKLSIKAREI